MSTAATERRRTETLDLDAALAASLEAIQEDLAHLQALSALERVHTLQEWGDLARLQIGALGHDERVIGDADDPFRPAGILCWQAMERLAARWVEAWLASDRKIADAVQRIAERKDDAAEFVGRVALAVALRRALDNARQPRGTCPLDLPSPAFRTWLRTRAFELAEAWSLEEAGADGQEPRVRGEEAEEGLYAHPDPLLWLLDGLPEEATAEEREIMDQLRLHFVEGCLPLAEAMSEIAWNRDESVDEVHAVLGAVARKMMG